MNGNLVKQSVALLAWAATLVVFSACSGSTQAATLSTETPQLAAASAPTQSTAAPSTSATSPANGGGDDLLAQGKLLYEKTAGGVGCAVCHGPDGKGASAPYNRGAPEWKVREVLESAAAMSFIKLNDQEIKAVVAYLRWLTTQP